MTPLFKKLNFKGQPIIYMVNTPSEVLQEKKDISTYTKVVSKLPESTEPVEFIIIFVTQLEEISYTIEKISPLLKDDAILWYAYPKGTSKRYKCEFNRDNGWSALGAHNMEPVRQVAINEDWSALRFRKVEYIKNFTRNESMILSDKGKEKKKEG